MLRYFVFVIFMLSGCVIPGLSIAEEFGATKSGLGDMRSCEDALDGLQISAADANNKAAAANRKFIEVDHCVNHPDDREIKNQFDDCDNLKWEYQNEMSDVDLEIRNVEAQLNKVQSACGYDFMLTLSGSK